MEVEFPADYDGTARPAASKATEGLQAASWSGAACFPCYYYGNAVAFRMLTVAETELFSRLVKDYWSEEERQVFAAYLATHPDAGEVVPHSGGVRKVRWSRKGMGKRGGVRVIYFNRLDEGEIWLLLIYAKSADDNIPAHVLRELKEELENG